MKRIAVMIAVLAVLAGCKRTPQKRVETVQQKIAAARPVATVEQPKAKGEAGTACPVLDAYPFPRSYEQMLADAPLGVRKPTGSLQVQMVIDADGNITHLRFTRLSSLDSVNKRAFEFVKNEHYKPTVFKGERVAVCTTMDINIDFQ